MNTFFYLLVFWELGILCFGRDGVQNEEGKRMAIFRRIEKGWKLANQKLKTLKVMSNIDCLLHCLADERCQSINYQELASSLVTTLCELNQETRNTRPDFYVPVSGFAYYELAKSPCSTSPCRNGGTDCEPVFDQDDVFFTCKCPSSFTGPACDRLKTDPQSNFQINFPRRTNKDVVENMKTLYLDKFTLTFTVKIDENKDHTFISYNSASSSNGIFIHQRGGKFFLWVQGEKFVYSANKIAADNKWHCVVVTWDSTDGAFQIFVDNSPWVKKKVLAKGLVIQGGGKFVLGNDLDSPTGNYVSADALVGTITRVNIWDFILPQELISSLCQGCGNEVGNALAWPELRNTTSTYLGVAAFQAPSSCVYP